MKILFVGEIVARPGRETVTEMLPKILKKEKPDLVLANIENIAHGRGATVKTIEEMQDLGIDFFTGGDHLFWHRGFEDEIEGLPLVRPANMEEGTPGDGHKVIDTKKGKVLIINVMSVDNHKFSEDNLDNPFLTAEKILRDHKDEEFAATIIDFHAEYTSDKHVMGFFLDGKVDAIVGSHSHVPTCDNRLFPKGTMYVTDVGMCGNIDSVLGVDKEIILNRAIYGKKEKFKWSLDGRRAFRSVIIDTDKKEIRRLDREVT